MMFKKFLTNLAVAVILGAFVVFMLIPRVVMRIVGPEIELWSDWSNPLETGIIVLLLVGAAIAYIKQRLSGRPVR